MTWTTDIKKRILTELAAEPADLFQLADTIGEPPFRVRAELLELRRERLVYRRHHGLRMLWGITTTGLAAVYEQPELHEAR